MGFYVGVVVVRKLLVERGRVLGVDGRWRGDASDGTKRIRSLLQSISKGREHWSMTLLLLGLEGVLLLESLHLLLTKSSGAGAGVWFRNDRDGGRDRRGVAVRRLSYWLPVN